MSHRDHTSLVRSLTAAAGEGSLWGAAVGALLATFQPWLRELLSAQADPAIALPMHLFICAEIGAATALAMYLLLPPREEPR